MRAISDTIRNKCQLIAGAFDLTMYFIDPTGAVLYENVHQTMPHPLLENNKQFFFNHINFDPAIANRLPIIKKTQFLERYILISWFNRQSHVFEGTVIIGPALSYSPKEEQIIGIINDSRAFFHRDRIFQYYNYLPIIPTKRLAEISSLLHDFINGELVSPETITIQPSGPAMENQFLSDVNAAISDHSQVATLQGDYRLFEQKLLDLVRGGRPEELKKLSSIKKEEEAASILSKSSYIRSLKNHIIALTTLVSRAAIEGGLQEELAYSMHDRYILQLEELNRLDDVKRLGRTVAYTFAKKVKEIRDGRYSQTITACKAYIDKHIYQEFNHDDIAHHVELSPKYLSVLFKQEVGISVSDYIQQAKIHEAKRLLAYSKTPLSEIASLLHFNDQSYFSRVFKKWVGATPRKYRETYHLLEEK